MRAAPAGDSPLLGVAKTSEVTTGPPHPAATMAKATTANTRFIFAPDISRTASAIADLLGTHCNINLACLP